VTGQTGAPGNHRHHRLLFALLSRL